MHDAHEFLKALTIVLCVAALTTVVFQRLRQPVVLGYILAGLLVGPYVPIPLVADQQVVHTLSELGVILLMFSLGLEFSLRKLFQVGPTAGVTAVVQCSFMLWLGFTVGRLFGWTLLESLFCGAIIAISSTTIIAKAFDEGGVKGYLREVVVGVLIVEDLIAILLMAVLTAVSTGHGLEAGALALTTGKLALFLVGLVAVGLLLIPRAVRFVIRLDRPETTLVAGIGICFAVALLAKELGYSVALGAFIAGSLVAESGEEEAVEALVRPVRDLFAAVFFVSVGMLIDPSVVVRHWAAVAALTAAVVLGKISSVALGAFVTGSGIRTSVQAGMSLAQIGEFSFIIAGLGLALGATREFLYPVAVAVSAVTTLLTPWLIRGSGSVATFVDRKLPRPLQTFAALYGSWVEDLRSAPAQVTRAARVRRLIRLLLVDAAILASIIIGGALSGGRIAAFVVGRLELSPPVARVLVVGAALALSLPFCAGIVRVARQLGFVLAEAALPEAVTGRVDLAAAPRRALVVTLQLVTVLFVGTPLVALTQPFLPAGQGAVVVVALVAVLGFTFWRSAANLQEHVRAGAQVIVEALASQTRTGRRAPGENPLSQVSQILPGLGTPFPVELRASSPSVGKTLAELNLRGLTGATVLAISRGGEGVIVPSASEVLRPGDVLALAGTKEAVEACKELLAP